MLTITGIDGLKAKVGQELGVSDWHEVTHGLYTLSLRPMLSYAMFSVEGFAFALNYGYDRVYSGDA